ncbi:hypothetical protein ELE36_12390 [Pseudolysobacter antarcticus]|uniref:Uncharacterized protein n=1 Tax=Pseudolysobacter antarcticus TaxID=2511995 RepID=A0A411HKP0_9GAMM|nr:YeeE/YedE thiosulfate transporter family protein [Pseudolysobacter antarcticus]QBB71085.1 hypothetical protein ELE36_12390 [Pseudolysobacter antarcticus]
MRTPLPYANPYVAGVGLGLVLLASFVLTGRGLGASGAFASASASLVSTIAPQGADTSAYFRGYLEDGGFASDWLVFEVLGLLTGAALSAVIAGRWRAQIERGPRLAARPRLFYAVAGGAAMGVGAMLARGCTSGQALSGGALLSVGSSLFMASVFASAYLVAVFARRLWS